MFVMGSLLEILMTHYVFCFIFLFYSCRSVSHDCVRVCFVVMWHDALCCTIISVPWCVMTCCVIINNIDFCVFLCFCVLHCILTCDHHMYRHPHPWMFTHACTHAHMDTCTDTHMNEHTNVQTQCMCVNKYMQ